MKWKVKKFLMWKSEREQQKMFFIQQVSFWPGHLALLWTLRPFDIRVLLWAQLTLEYIGSPLSTFYCSISFALSSRRRFLSFTTLLQLGEIRNWSMLFLNSCRALSSAPSAVDFHHHLLLLYDRKCIKLSGREGGYKLRGLASHTTAHRAHRRAHSSPIPLY